MLEENLGKYINLIVEVTNIKEIMTKNNDVMAFVKGSDEFKQIDITFFPKTYKENNNLTNHDIINVYGKIEKRLDSYQIIASKIIKLNKE